MNNSLLKFTLFGIPVHVELSYLFLCLLLGSGSAGAVVNTAFITVVTLALLGHELGHAMVLRKIGIPSQIHLIFMGGQTVWQQQFSFHRSWGILLNAAGIVVNILLASIGFTINQSGVEISNLFFNHFFFFLFYVNVFLAVLNLLPVLPLDGGKLFHTICGYFMDERRGIIVTLIVSSIVATAVAILSYLYTRYLFIPLIFGFFAFDNFRKLRMVLSAR